MAAYNWVDYIFIGIFFLSTLIGFSRGLVKEVLSLGFLIAAFVIAIMFSDQLAAYFTSSATMQNMVNQSSNAIGTDTTTPASYAAIGSAFCLLFFGTLIVGWIITFLISFVFQAGILGIGNRFLGAGFGLARGFLITLVIIFIIQLTPFSAEEGWQKSTLVRVFQPGVIKLGDIVSPSLENLKSRFGSTLQNMDSKLRNTSG